MSKNHVIILHHTNLCVLLWNIIFFFRKYTSLFEKAKNSQFFGFKINQPGKFNIRSRHLQWSHLFQAQTTKTTTFSSTRFLTAPSTIAPAPPINRRNLPPLLQFSPTPTHPPHLRQPQSAAVQPAVTHRLGRPRIPVPATIRPPETSRTFGAIEISELQTEMRISPRNAIQIERKFVPFNLQALAPKRGTRNRR